MKMILIAAILISPYSMYAMQLRRQNLKTLYQDIANGDADAVKNRLDNYPGAITQIYSDMTPLHAAINPHFVSGARKGTIAQMVTTLIEYKAFIEERDKLSFTPLAKAARERNHEGVQALVNHGANVNVWDSAACMTPLGYAVENDDIKTASILLNAGACCDELIKDRNELVWIEQDKAMKIVLFTSEQFLERYGSPEMKTLFKNFKDRSLPVQAAKEQAEIANPRIRPAKKVRIAEENLN